MPGSATEYDSELLASAPEATKAQVQSGYAVDLLDERDHPGRTPQADKAEAPRPTTATRVPTPPLDGKTPRRPFYRTRRGIIIIIVAFVAIVAVIVGIGVGVSQRPHSESNATAQPNGVDTATATQSTTTPFPGGGKPTTPAPTLTPAPTTAPPTTAPPTPPGNNGSPSVTPGGQPVASVSSLST